jgi:D-serine dehydratase
MAERNLVQLAAESEVNGFYRGMPAAFDAIPLERLGMLGLSVSNEDLSLPVLTLSETAFAHNVEIINAYAAEHDVYLCAHGKTMMAPQLLREVLAGPRTIGLCAATVSQASVMAACGAPTVFIVNQLVGRTNIARFADLIAANPDKRFLVLIDSVEGIDLLLQHGSGRLSDRHGFEVLIEVGPPGGRAGVRTMQQARALIDRLSACRAGGAPIVLAGVSTYEGAVPSGEGWLDRVDALFDLTREVYVSAAPILDTRHAPIISAGGSATFDLVVGYFTHRQLPGGPQLWLRPGVAPTYDHIVYQERLRQMDARGGLVLHGRTTSAVEAFSPALALWAAVQSIPEPGIAIIAAGMRDFPVDAGYPTLLAQYRGGKQLAAFAAGDISIVRANDQHAYLPIGDRFNARVGDVLKFGISHPCTAFDKWPVLFCIDEHDRITRAVRTYF